MKCNYKEYISISYKISIPFKFAWKNIFYPKINTNIFYGIEVYVIRIQQSWIKRIKIKEKLPGMCGIYFF